MVALPRILYKYRVTPQSTTDRTPAEMMFGRRLRTHLDLMFPDLQTTVHKKQEEQKEDHDKRSRERKFHDQDQVFFRNYGSYG